MSGPVTDPEIANPNPEGLTFPYPLPGNTIRPPGQGCMVCVHQGYCPAVYWFYRYTQEKLTSSNGRRCASYSVNPADKVTTVSANDLKENQYIYEQGIGQEANHNGITSPVTGNAISG